MSYSFEWTAGPAVLGALLFLLFVPGLALIAVVVVALVAAAALVALAGAILATPFLLVRTLHRRVAERHRSTEGSGTIATAISGLTALAEPTTARRAQ